LSVDWARAEKRPKKTQKVAGHILLDLRERINELKRNLAHMAERFSSAKKNVDLISKQKFDVDIDISNLKSHLEEIFTENEELRGELKFSSEKIDELEHNLASKNKAIKKHKEDLLKNNQEIDLLKKKSDEISTLESKLTKLENTPNVLDRIKEVMLHKGFLSDQELYEIEEKLQK